jgi:hypothetical protein
MIMGRFWQISLAEKFKEKSRFAQVPYRLVAINSIANRRMSLPADASLARLE